jgi:hypothetical protein
MSFNDSKTPPPGGQFLVNQTENGKLRIDVRFEGETVWLTQQHMAELFQTTKQNIGQHLKSIFVEGELTQNSVVKDSFTTAADGKNYATRFYNLDAIISVGYRVKSAVATRFRIWATQRLREFIVKGFVLDDERLKNPDQPFDYFEELMRRIQDIRTSERRFYQKITDIYATSIDYDPTQGQPAVFQGGAEQGALGHHRADGGGDRPRAGGCGEAQPGADELAGRGDSQAGCCHREELFERAGTGGAEQSRGGIPHFCPRPGHAAGADAHGGLDREAERIPDVERP